jgi:hypothetical protein
MLLDDRQQQVALLGAFVNIALQQTPGTGKPAGRPAHLAAHQQAKAEPERATNGAGALAGPDICVVGAFECLKVFVIVTDEVCRHRKQLEILGAQQHFLIGERKRAVGVSPCPTLVTSPAAFEVITAIRVPVFMIALIGAFHILIRISPQLINRQQHQHSLNWRQLEGQRRTV